MQRRETDPALKVSSRPLSALGLGALLSSSSEINLNAPGKNDEKKKNDE